MRFLPDELVTAPMRPRSPVGLMRWAVARSKADAAGARTRFARSVEPYPKPFTASRTDMERRGRTRPDVQGRSRRAGNRFGRPFQRNGGKAALCPSGSASRRASDVRSHAHLVRIGSPAGRPRRTRPAGRAHAGSLSSSIAGDGHVVGSLLDDGCHVTFIRGDEPNLGLVPFDVDWSVHPADRFTVSADGERGAAAATFRTACDEMA